MPADIELLAPARSADIAIEAIRCGADAVYIGGPSHGARQAASNSIDEIARVCRYAHRYNAKVYVTLNTLVYDSEMANVVGLTWRLYAAGVDALIVQDMGLLMQHLPPIALHASTQCDIRTPARAHFLQEAGFSQLVLPRELTLDEIRKMNSAVKVPLEAFVHGALCVSYSGDCQASYISIGRSANRGECAQICRYKFNLEDSTGKQYLTGKHLLSLRDLSRLDALEAMLDAGIRSFKIEGRLKDADYVKNVVAAYSGRLNEVIASYPGCWQRCSLGRSTINFTPDVERSFNRGFTSYFLQKPTQALRMSSMSTPKFMGKKIGRIIRLLRPNTIEVQTTVSIANGDGLGYFNAAGQFTGFRVNRVEGNRLYLAQKVEGLTPGQVLYRNADKQFTDAIQRTDAASRFVDIDAVLRPIPKGISLRLDLGNGIFAEEALRIDIQQSRTPQHSNHKNIVGKLGDTAYRLRNLDDRAADLFLPASVLTSLRRKAVAALDSAIRLRHDFHRRPVNEIAAQSAIPHYPASEPLPTRHLNIANKWAEEFYKKSIGNNAPLPYAVEVDSFQRDNNGELRVMQTRYCVRRELGACIKTADGKKLPKDLWLRSENLRLRLEFDCANCRMNVYHSKES